MFLDGLRGNLNASIGEADAIDMLSQHLITKPVFEALFEGYSFAAHNPVSQVMDSMIEVLDRYNLDSEVAKLEHFYRSVRVRAEGITTAEGKQKIVTELYERFFKLAFPRTAESLGIVYTPVEVVDFIIRAVDDVLQKEFGASVSDEGVHILDPFTGTGTFIVRLLQSGRIKPQDLLRKYTQELHANELLLMAYYIAAINIEATLHGLLEDQARESGGSTDSVEYLPFDGIVLTDTFQMTEDGDTLDEHVFTSNSERASAQNKLDIRVIIGNPPYSVGQTSGNDNNANIKYPTLDESIRTTYAERSTATNKNSLYDSYIRAIRWASNRILNSPNGGVVCYVSNGGYIDGNTADGLRKTLVDEFHEIYVYNLRGNQRTAGEQSRKEGGKIFDSGSRNTVAVLLLVKRPGLVEKCRLNYRDIGDYLGRKDKLSIVEEGNLATIEWRSISPNVSGDWINQRSDVFETYAPISARDGANGIFASNGRGLESGRDAWVYNYSQEGLKSNVGRMIRNYNAEVERWTSAGSPQPIEKFITADATKISWARSLRNALSKGRKLEEAPHGYRTSIYRPFNRQNVYFGQLMNHERGQQPTYFPESNSKNFGWYIVAGTPRTPFSVIAVDSVPDVGFFMDAAQLFPRYTYTRPSAGEDLLADLSEPLLPSKIDNITDNALAEYRATYGSHVSKDDIFYYTYGLLHSPEYRKRFASDLKRMLPRIPMVSGEDRFKDFATAGRTLAELHIGYETVEPFPIVERQTGLGLVQDEFERYRVTKMKYGGKSGAWDKTRIIYNAHITLEEIPEAAQEYMLGARSALDWILDRYQVKKDKASGIVNDPNEWSREHQEPRYIRDLIGRIVTVSMETMRLVDGLPTLGFEDSTGSRG